MKHEYCLNVSHKQKKMHCETLNNFLQTPRIDNKVGGILLISY